MRHGTDDGLVTLGGRQVPVTRPRFVAVTESALAELMATDLSGSTSSPS